MCRFVEAVGEAAVEQVKGQREATVLTEPAEFRRRRASSCSNASEDKGRRSGKTRSGCLEGA